MAFERVGKKYTCKMYVKKLSKGALERREKYWGKINFTES
jgi:hypothetical protein